MEALVEDALPYLRREKGIHPHARDNTHLYGYAVLTSSFLFFSTTMYWVLVSKFMPDTGNPLLDWIKHDEYYCLVVLSCIPVSFVIVYFNWLAFKFFRHNS
jgi:hypothetical protein